MPRASNTTSAGGSANVTPQKSSPIPRQTSPNAASPTNTHQSLSTQMRNVTISKPQDPKRKLPAPSGPGKAGKALTLLSNHFILNPKSLPDFAYRWNVDIKKCRDKQPIQATVIGRVKRRVLELLIEMTEFNRGIYTDYEKTLWSFVALSSSPNVAKVVLVDYYEPEERGPRKDAAQVLYQVTISKAADPLPTEPLKALLKDPSPETVIERPVQEYEDLLNNVILRFPAQDKRLTTAARGTKALPLTKDFPQHSAAKHRDLGAGLNATRGYMYRARIEQGGPHVTLQVTHAITYQPGPAKNLIADYRRSHGNSPSSLNAFLRRVRVQGQFGSNRVKPIFEVGRQNARDTLFYCENHPTKDIAIKERRNICWWFREAYCIEIDPNDMVLNVGTKLQPVWWPSALSDVLPGQSYKSLLPLSEQQQKMITFACKLPNENKGLILSEGMEMIGVLNKQGSEAAIADSPLMIWLTPSEVKARLIPSPAIELKGNKKILSSETGRGQWNLANAAFREKPNDIRVPYTILVLKRSNQEQGIQNLDTFTEEIERGISKYCGFNIEAISVSGMGRNQIVPQTDLRGFLGRLFVHCLKNGVRHTFVIPSDRRWYPDIKIAGDTAGMQTTVTLRTHKPRPNSVKALPGEIANLLLKYSMKAGGSNWTLGSQDFQKLVGDDTMLVGIDVVHPPPGALKGAPSVVGMVSSTSSTPSQFTPQLMVQHNPDDSKKSMEIVTNLAPLIKKAISRWQAANNGKLPKQIFVCRDGVSDAQLEQLLDVELDGIKQGIKQANAKEGQEPRIFVLNTQKRHMTRFFQDGNKVLGLDAKKNPLPGIIVDTKIVSRERDDWYHVGHKALQGQTKPAHHIRVWDEIKLSKDILEQLVHNLSFIFPRSVTSVSIPTPAKLADLLCERGKVHLHDVYFPSEKDRDAGTSYDPKVHFSGDHNIHPFISETMYYL